MYKKVFLVAISLILGATTIAYAAPNAQHFFSIVPFTTDTYDVGTSTLEFNSMWTKNINISGNCTGIGCGIQLNANNIFTGTNTFIGTTTLATTTLIAQDKGGEIFNVKAYGAKGDGITDDTAAIQSVIDLLPINGGVIYFPTGRYELSNTLIIKKHGVTLQGSKFVSTFADQINQQPGDIGTSVIEASSTLGFPNNTPIVQAGELGTSKMWTGGGVYDLVLLGTKGVGADRPGDCIDIFNVQAFRVIDNGLTKCYHGVLVRSDQAGGLSNVDVEHNIIYFNSGNAIRMADGSQENYVRFNYISNAVGYGIYTGDKGNTILNNHLEAISASTTLTFGGTAIFLSNSRAFVYNNDILTTDYHCIYIGASDTAVDDNHCNDPNTGLHSDGSGIWVAGSLSDVMINGNEINDFDSKMIYGIDDNTDAGGVIIGINNITGQTKQKIITAHNNLSPVYFLSNFGIGTTTPTFGLSVAKNSTNGWFGISNLSAGDLFNVRANGFVGIGSSTPDSTFSVIGGLKLLSLSFPGNQSVKLTATSSIPNTNQNITIEAYVYPTSATAGVAVSLQDNAASTNLLALVYEGVTGNFKVEKNGTDLAGTAVNAQPLNTWYDVVYTYDGTTNSLYINGSLASSTVVTHNNGISNVVDFGRRETGAIFIGNLDNIRIWNTALSSGLISTMYNSYSGTPRSGLVGEWLFDEGVGSTALDTSGTGNNGFNSGALYSTNLSGEVQPTAIEADFTALGNATSTLRLYTSGQVDGGWFNATIGTSTLRGVNLPYGGCFAIAGTCIATNSGTAVDPFTHGAAGWSATTSLMLNGTSTPIFSNLTIGTSTVPQLSLSDNTAADNSWTLRSIANSFYLATSTATATSTTAALTINSNNIANFSNLVGISSSSPSGTLGVVGTGFFSGNLTSLGTYRSITASNTKYFDAFTSDGNERFSINYVNSNYLELQSFTSTKLAINDQGNNVSIGTSANGSPLTINGGTTIGSGYNSIAAQTNGLLVQGISGFGTSTPWGQLSASSTSATVPAIAAEQKSTGPVAIFSGGNVGIGTTTPWLQFSTTGRVAFPGIGAAATGDSAACITAGELTINSGVTTCLISSARYKHDIQPLGTSTAMTELLALKPSTFTYNTTNKKDIGLIAEDAFAVDPRLAAKNDKGQVQSLNLEDFIALLAKGFQNIEYQVQNILARLDGDEKKINALQQQVTFQQKEIDAIKAKLK